MPLQLNPHFHKAGQHPLRDFTPGDDFYAQLIHAHRDLSDEQSALLNAKLILLLSNHIGEQDILREALTLARQDI
ncbi:DUF2783 domain-containing protein [Aquabacterium sp.]|uniref:DUF2783 domain-containing protein n=1 Tax=Aquabacterium sp. TaxID=1872578 RepID=UPI003BB081A6